MKQLTAARQSQPLRLIPLHALRGQRCAPFIDFLLGLQQRVHHLPGPVVKGLFIEVVVYLHQLAQALRAVELLAALQPVMHQHALDLGQGAYRLNSQHAPFWVMRQITQAGRDGEAQPFELDLDANAGLIRARHGAARTVQPICW